MGLWELLGLLGIAEAQQFKWQGGPAWQVSLHTVQVLLRGSLTHQRPYTCEAGPCVWKGLWKENLRGVATLGQFMWP